MSDFRPISKILEDLSEEDVKDLIGMYPKTYCEENRIWCLKVFKSKKEKDFWKREFRRLNEARNEILDLAKAAERYSVSNNIYIFQLLDIERQHIKIC